MLMVLFIDYFKWFGSYSGLENNIFKNNIDI